MTTRKTITPPLPTSATPRSREALANMLRHVGSIYTATTRAEAEAAATSARDYQRETLRAYFDSTPNELAATLENAVYAHHAVRDAIRTAQERQLSAPELVVLRSKERGGQMLSPRSQDNQERGTRCTVR